MFKQLNSPFMSSLITSVCSLSLFASPLLAQCNDQANECCTQANECCISDPNRTALIIGTGIALGAAGGVAAGYAISRGDHHHHHRNVSESSCSCSCICPPGPVGPAGVAGPAGPAGATGPAGPGPFVTNTGQALTFSLFLTPTVATNFPISAVPFVTTPDGRVIEGVPSLIDAPVTTALTPIVLPNPVFGEYQVGVEFNSFGVTVASITGNVASSINPILTDLHTTNISTFTGVGQESVPFSYNVIPAPVPPS